MRTPITNYVPPTTLNYFNYFSEIEEAFIRRRGKSIHLSPLDWALMEEWEQREVPLHIILRAIEKVFDNYDANPKRNRTIKGLTYCREEIEAQYEEWRESQIGKAGTAEEIEPDEDFSERTIGEHLANLSNELERCISSQNPDLAEILTGVIFRLSGLKESKINAESLENELTKLEDSINEGLLTRADAKLLAKLRAETTAELQAYRKTMTNESYQKTFDLLLLKKLRLETGIPRLSLFYL